MCISHLLIYFVFLDLFITLIIIWESWIKILFFRLLVSGAMYLSCDHPCMGTTGSTYEQLHWVHIITARISMLQFSTSFCTS
ncbi:hypothetical protein PGTUg99_050174 [Puccinia graminis f. sp. tritici]|uniref:Uncharacterized protein n=1 Tax=Puccinia graminis f. sp. tritici TaxID=56615 RepID=A0A5B0RTR3_PUCGR|nr:hypothetical protein PGTUg99_050174 [Puccinia graminis f. sp. tritici]